MYRRLPLVLGLTAGVLMFYNTFLGMLAACTRNPQCNSLFPNLFLVAALAAILGAIVSASRNPPLRLVGGSLLLAAGSFGISMRLIIYSLNSYSLLAVLDGSVLALVAGLVVVAPEASRLIFPKRSVPTSIPEIARSEPAKYSGAKLVLLALSIIGLVSELVTLQRLGFPTLQELVGVYTLVGTLLAIAGTSLFQGRTTVYEAIGSLLLATGGTILVVVNLVDLIPFLRGDFETITGAIVGTLFISGSGFFMSATLIAIFKVILQRPGLLGRTL